MTAAGTAVTARVAAVTAPVAAVTAPVAAAARAGLPGRLDPLCARALSIWPGLDPAKLRRTRGDPVKLARLVARRTIHSEEMILSLLLGA